MGVIADLLKEIPDAARYKHELESLEKKAALPENENLQLRSELQEIKAIAEEAASQNKRGLFK